MGFHTVSVGLKQVENGNMNGISFSSHLSTHWDRKIRPRRRSIFNLFVIPDPDSDAEISGIATPLGEKERERLGVPNGTNDRHLSSSEVTPLTFHL